MVAANSLLTMPTTACPGESDPRMATHLPGLAGCETTGTQDHSDVIGRVELEEITHWPS